MTLDAADTYPGELARPSDLLALAEEYRKAALLAAQLRQRGRPISMAPYRLNAIHAVELYLNALLLHVGHDPGRIRGLQHDLAARTDLAVASGLQLKHRTAAHLRAMTASREYLVSRYSPELAPTLSQFNRLAATLDEVSAKAAVLISSSPR